MAVLVRPNPSVEPLGCDAAAVVADLGTWLPAVLDEPAIAEALKRAIERHDLNRPPLQIARRVFAAVSGRAAPVRLSSVSALIHVGAGLHDDVADGDIEGGRFAQAQALLIAGVCIATLAPQAVLTLVPTTAALPALAILWRGLQAMAGGQRRDLRLHGDPRPDPRYVEAALEKTSGECGLYAALGALVAGASESDISDWERIGAQIGYALQLISDCQDVVDPAGRDIASGARTLPIALALQSGDEDARTRLRDLLARAPHDPAVRALAREAILATRSLAACATLVEAAVTRAEHFLGDVTAADAAQFEPFLTELSWLRRT